MKRFILPMMAAAFVFLPPLAGAQPEAVPETVMKGLKARFPHSEITKWTKEQEGEMVIYDFEFTQEGHRLEADVKEDGSIHNWEKEVSPQDLPAAVTKTVSALYPGSTMKEAMLVTEVEDGTDEPEGYEILLRTSDGREVEVAVSPGGEVLEDSGEEE